MLQSVTGATVVLSDMSKHGHDYDAAKALALKGLTLKQISEQLNIPYDALQQTAYRHNWTTDKTRVRQVVSDHVTGNLKEQSEQWLLSISNKALRVLTDLESYNFGERVKELGPEEWVRTLDCLDKMARRTYGLDRDTGQRSGTLVQVNVASGSTAQVKRVGYDSLADVDSEADASTTSPPLPPA